MSSNLKSEFIERLQRSQLDTGEFRTHVVPMKGDEFVIGPSPFVTAHIAYFLNDVADFRTKKIVREAIKFMESLDDTGLRIYKFWYKGINGTSYPFLPFDIDDTAVVNQVLALNGRKTVNNRIILDNTDISKRILTWLRPSPSNLIRFPRLLLVLYANLRSFRLFSSSGSNPPMARYDDSEAIVRLNVMILLSIKDLNVSDLGEVMLFSPNSIKIELNKSIHYDNVSMYYLTLSKLLKNKNMTGNENMTANLLAKGIKQYAMDEHQLSFADRVALMLSLAYIDRLSDNGAKEVLGLAEKVMNDIDMDYNVCVGNKLFDNPHRYVSKDFTLAMLICLMNIIAPEAARENLH